MEKTLREKFDGSWQKPEEVVGRWKAETSGKAVGLVHTDVPYEMVHAAGALPQTVLAREVSFQNADKHLQGFACSYSRSVVELVESGRLGHLDGLIVPYACDTTRCLDLIFKFLDRFDFHDCLRIPKRVDARGVRKYFREELMRVANRLAEFTGNEITPERLAESISQYNRVRELLERLREGLRWGGLGNSASDYFSAVRAAMVLPPEASEKILAEAIEAGEGYECPEEGDPRPRVVVAGKVAEPPSLVEVLEGAGLWIVEDHLVVGGRWASAIPPKADDPWDALVERQLNLLPFAGIWDKRPSRASYLKERVLDLDADGAIFLVQKFCELGELDYPGIKEELEKEDIPLLSIETDFGDSSLEAVKTRVEAFAEMLKK